MWIVKRKREAELRRAYDTLEKQITDRPRSYQEYNAILAQEIVERQQAKENLLERGDHLGGGENKRMPVGTMLLGLVPIMFSTGTGADVMKRIAAPMVGGIGTSAILELLIYPAIYLLWKQRDFKKGAEVVR